MATEAYPLSGGSYDFVLIKGDVSFDAEQLRLRDEFLGEMIGPSRPEDVSALERAGIT